MPISFSMDSSSLPPPEEPPSAPPLSGQAPAGSEENLTGDSKRDDIGSKILDWAAYAVLLALAIGYPWWAQESTVHIVGMWGSAIIAVLLARHFARNRLVFSFIFLGAFFGAGLLIANGDGTSGVWPLSWTAAFWAIMGISVILTRRFPQTQSILGQPRERKQEKPNQTTVPLEKGPYYGYPLGIVIASAVLPAILIIAAPFILKLSPSTSVMTWLFGGIFWYLIFGIIIFR